MAPHETLFVEYVAALSEAMTVAVEWWQALVAREQARGPSEQQALDRLQRRWPFGPASHPRVLGVYRTFFLRCEALNEETAAPAAPGRPATEDEWGGTSAEPGEFDGPISGWVLLVDMLWGRHDDLAEFLQGMVLKPVGTDPVNGQFV